MKTPVPGWKCIQILGSGICFSSLGHSSKTLVILLCSHAWEPLRLLKSLQLRENVLWNSVVMRNAVVESDAIPIQRSINLGKSLNKNPVILHTYVPKYQNKLAIVWKMQRYWTFLLEGRGQGASWYRREGSAGYTARREELCRSVWCRVKWVESLQLFFFEIKISSVH